MKEITIKEIYAGKPDAKDEINFEGLDNFIKTFVVADHFNIDSLINGTNCFITGFKGTGKTALLFYLDSKLKNEDPNVCSSFVFFKEDFTDAKRDELQAMAHRILSSVQVESGALIDAEEFEYIWRWIFFKMIVRDNEAYNRHLFEDDENWCAFEKTVNLILSPRDKRKIQIPKTLRLAIPYKDPSSGADIAPEMEIDLAKQQESEYQNFVDLIDQAESQFLNLTRTDIPYYIFVDELEAYYGDEKIFRRDLRMIRDLIFTVKNFNMIFHQSNMESTKIICSVRSEILTAISRFVVTKELNKVTAGFSVPLNWNYTNSNSYAHPIIKILLRRIAVCSDCENESDLSIYKRWFPEDIHGIEPASYILNNTWCKPRDIVRLISSAQNSLHNNSSSFTAIVFNSAMKAYSEESLQEIKEELRALYSAEQIDQIITCFTGFRTSFSIADLRARIKSYLPDSVLDKNFIQVLNDLYRLGFIGNFLPAGKVYHWQHKGDSQLIMSDEWRVCVHYALHSALSIGSRNDYGLTRGQTPQPGDVVKVTVKKINSTFVLVSFSHYGIEYEGCIRAKEFRRVNKTAVTYIRKMVNRGDKFTTSIISYSQEHSNWLLHLLEDNWPAK